MHSQLMFNECIAETRVLEREDSVHSPQSTAHRPAVHGNSQQPIAIHTSDLDGI